MSGRIRSIISDKLSQYIKVKDLVNRLEILPKNECYCGKQFGALMHLVIEDANDAAQLFKAIPEIKFNAELIEDVKMHPATGKTPAKCEIRLQPQAFVKDVFSRRESATQRRENSQSHVVVEFSSPNIAKPFHVGHLRSTIIGNAIANLHRNLSYPVTKLNYLGDWGTQFGLLQVGVEIKQYSEEEIQKSPIECLYRAYVAANLAAKGDPLVAKKAREYFTVLENASNPALTMQWKKYRQYTIVELDQMYSRLGVQFDQYDWESQYSLDNLGDVINALTHNNLLLSEFDGRRVLEIEGRRVPIIKSDGSTLYLARDIAALLDRFVRFKFEHIYYVVDNSQSDHFRACFKTTSRICDNLPLGKMTHVKFGRIRGMSTRSGNTVFLSEVLDEARDIMLEKQKKSQNTKITIIEGSANEKDVADILGVSAVIVNDLKQRRQRDYQFDWDKVLQVNGDSGIKMQYTHCRLHSLLQNVDHVDIETLLPSMDYLQEPEAQELLLEIARFDQAVWKSKQTLEPCVLVNYLFSLCNSISRALKYLPVKKESHYEKQQHRVLLFKTAKERLSVGMRILGLNPLEKM